MAAQNSLGQPIGSPLPADWSPPDVPTRRCLEGRRVRVEPLDPDGHARQLFEANRHDLTGQAWTYMAYGPFATMAAYRAWMERDCRGDDPMYFAYVDRSNELAVGLGAYLRIKPRDGVIEVGSIVFSPLMARSPLATEAMYLKMKNAFDLGYRRYEWKCDALNEPSRRAAERLGFTFEGVFRQATHYKGRNRDTAWYAIIDRDWPSIAAAHAAWLDPANFDGAGHQRQALAEFLAKTSSADRGFGVK